MERKKTGTLIFCTLVLQAVTVAQADMNDAMPWLRAEGVHIVDDRSSRVKLRGVNLEGWLMWQGPIWGAGFKSHSNISDALRDLSSDRDFESFRRGVYDNFITEKDIIRIREMGANVVRLPFHYRLIEDNASPFTYRPGGWDILDRFLDLCAKHTLYVILDPHALPGGQSPNFVADPPGARGLLGGKSELWDSSQNLERSVALWKALARRYANRSVIAGYDLMAAPDPPAGREAEAIDLYRRIIAAIREVDPTHMVFLHGTQATMNLKVFKEPLDANQIYEPHQYTWLFGNPKRQIRKAREQLAKWQAISVAHQVPLWIGEFGENRYDTLRNTVALYENPANGVSGWGFWVWKRTATRYPPLAEIMMPPSWKRIVQWIAAPRWPHRKPTPVETIEGMTAFLEAIKIENCMVNTAMAELLPF